MEIGFSFGIFILTIWGYYLYGKNIFDQEVEDFYILPWITFSFLAGLDLMNILLSEGRLWFEVFAGGIMFIGPLGVSTMILYNGFSIHGSENKFIFFIQKIKTELISSKVEALLLLIGVIILVLLSVVDRFLSWGENYWVELIFAGATILLDVIAIIALTSEIRQNPGKFELLSWLLWLIAGISATWWNISTGAEIFAIGTILIFESALISVFMLLFISYFRAK